MEETPMNTKEEALHKEVEVIICDSMEEDKQDAEEPIDYINLDEIDGSDSDEPPSKFPNLIALMNDRETDEDVLEFMKSLGMKGSPDSLELEILKMPPREVIVSETKQVRDSRRIIVYPVQYVDLSHSILQGILSQDNCSHFSIKYDRNGCGTSAWSGSILMHFETGIAATAAIGELRQIRKSLHIEQGSFVGSKFSKIQPDTSKKEWTDMMLLVKNIGDSTNEKVLQELFPDADVIVHKDRAGQTSKGHAYVLYSSVERADEVLKKYSEKKLELNDRRLVLQKWRHTPTKIIPEGMLRIGERRLVMNTLEDTNSKLEKSVDKEYLLDKVKFLQDLLEKDEDARKLLSLPSPSYEQLKNLSSLRQFGDSEANQILKRLLDPFEKMMKEKERENPKSREKESENQKNQDSVEKSKGNKSQPGVTGGNKSNSKGNAKRDRTSTMTSKSGTTSLKRPIPLLSTPMQPIKRNRGTGLLGAGPGDPTLSKLLQRQQQTNLVQPLMSQSLLQPQQPLLQAPSLFAMTLPSGANPATGLFGDQPSLLGSFPGDAVAQRGFNIEPSFPKIADRDTHASSYDERVRSMERSRDEVLLERGRENWKVFRDEVDDRLGKRRDRQDDYHKELLNTIVDQGLLRDDRSIVGHIDGLSTARSLLMDTLAGHQKNEESGRGEFRREWDQAGRYDDREERLLLSSLSQEERHLHDGQRLREERRLHDGQGRGDDHLSRLDEDSSRIQSSSNSVNTDAVSLLLNLSQLLAEKLQRDKEKDQTKRGGY